MNQSTSGSPWALSTYFALKKQENVSSAPVVNMAAGEASITEKEPGFGPRSVKKTTKVSNNIRGLSDISTINMTNKNVNDSKKKLAGASKTSDCNTKIGIKRKAKQNKKRKHPPSERPVNMNALGKDRLQHDKHYAPPKKFYPWLHSLSTPAINTGDQSGSLPCNERNIGEPDPERLLELEKHSVQSGQEEGRYHSLP